MKIPSNKLSLIVSGLLGLTLMSCSSDKLELPEITPPSVTPETPEPLSCDAPEVANEAGDSCVLPPATVTAQDNEAVIFYNRPDGEYDGWVLHLWNNDTCPDTVAEPTTWPDGPSIAGVDPAYGGYFIIPLMENYSACMNFIVHDADGNKDLPQQDRMMDLSGDRMAWTLSGVPDVFYEAIVEIPVTVQNAEVHWVYSDTLVWGADTSQYSDIRLYWSETGDLQFDAETGVEGDNFVSLTLGESENSEAALALNQAQWDSLNIDAELSQIKQMLKSQLVVVATDHDGEIAAATRVQIAPVLDDLYTSGDNDADEASYGPQYNEGEVTLNLWAPTAQDVKLNLYDTDKSLLTSSDMNYDGDTGIWTYTGSATDLDRKFYRFEVTVFHPVENAVITTEATDPYSVSVATNGRYSQVVNLADDDLKPANWDDHVSPELENFEDAVIYEAHIRDFSALDSSVSSENQGKYLAYTESNSVAVQHLQSLTEKGLNFYHIMPANDIATINEDESQTINLDNTVAELCAVNGSAPVCGVEDDGSTLLSVFESYDPATEDAQALVSAMRGLDSFNWGYDPHHFNVPEGSYSSDPDGTARILEMRAMIKALHDMGMRVALDVVYNHTSSSGINLNSVFDKVVPGYYHRYNRTTGDIERSTCCENTATENRMMAKFMQDSLVLWAEQYRYDSFRFDLMGHIPKDAILESWEAVKAVDPDNYFYGEGWDFGEVGGDRLFEQATQKNMAGTEVGTFNDQIREAIRGAAMFSGDTGTGTLRVQDKIRMSLAGTLMDFQFVSSTDAFIKSNTIGGYATDPADIINYVSKHDNETLWDQLNYSLPADISLEDRVRAQNISMATTLLSQGIPFLQQGGDLLRSKSMDRNTYDAGDWFNRIDFSMNGNNWNVGMPLQSENGGRWDEIRPILADSNRATSMSDIQFAAQIFKEYLEIRQSTKLFRLTTGEQVKERIGFHNVGSEQQAGLIVMSIDDGTGLEDLDPLYDAVVVVINTTDSSVTHSIPTASGFALHPVLASSIDTQVMSASFTENGDSGEFTVPAYSLAVFVKAQQGAQGTGLNQYATIGTPDLPVYGNTTVYIRGSMNDWGTSNPMSYQGSGIYQASLSLEEGVTYEFKFASEDWATVNFGGGANGDIVSAGEPLELGFGNNLLFTPDSSESYIFEVDASDAQTPVITVRVEQPFPGTTVFLRGSMNDWSESNPFVYDGAGIYSVVVDLAAGDYEFKVASADWETVNLGGNGDALTLESEYGLFSGAGNIQMSVASEGTYIFTLDAANLDATTLSVYQGGMYGDTPVFVRGTMNDWSTSNQMEFDGVKLYTAEIELSAGSYEFKVASEDWATVDLGAGSQGNTVIVGERVTLAPVGGDLSLDVSESGTYLFEVIGPSTEAPDIRVTRQ